MLKVKILTSLLTCNPFMQQMTEASVAKERAKLYTEMKQKMGHQMLAANADELASLKDKYVSTSLPAAAHL